MEIRAIADLDVTRDIRSRAFGPMSETAWAASTRFSGPTVAAGRQFAGFDGDRPVATARIHDLRQWWNGGLVPMGGVGGVTVSPEDRGRGIGREMMTFVLERCASLGHAISVLFPATTHLYRSLGWEHAGAQDQVVLPAEALRSLAAGRVPVRRAGPRDASEVAAVLRRLHGEARDAGPLDWLDQWWEGVLGAEDNYYYLAEDGFLAYRWNGDNTALHVDRVVAGSERTLRALWAIVGSGSSTAAAVRASIATDDPILWLLGERSLYEDLHRARWMLRVVDAPAAIAARGYPEGVSADVPLHVEDAQLPANSGSWRLVIKDGRGALERSGDDPAAVRMGIQGLSALYAGVRVAALRRGGLISGGDPAPLGTVFEAAPFMHDYF